VVNSRDEHNWEVMKLYFEFFKHFTTISTATAVVELVLYQQFSPSLKTLLAGVSTLAVTLLLSVIGMSVILTNSENVFPAIGTTLSILMILVGMFFFTGLLWFGTLFVYTASS
jgi:hypothetical protein